MDITRIRLCVALLVVTAGFSLNAQQPRVLQPDEYGRWEQLAAQRTPLSPDGGGSSTASTARIARTNCASSRRPAAMPIVVAYRRAAVICGRLEVGGVPGRHVRRRGSQAAEGQEADSEAARARQPRGRTPRRRSSGGVVFVQSVRNAHRDTALRRAFDNGSKEALAMKPPTPAKRSPGHAARRAQPGDRTGRDVRIGVGDRVAGQGPGCSRSRSPSRAASATACSSSTPTSGMLRDARFVGVAPTRVWHGGRSRRRWRRCDRRGQRRPRRADAHAAGVDRRDVKAATMRRARACKSWLPAELRVVRFRAPQWSEDGAWVFVGVAPWHAKAARARPRSLAAHRRHEHQPRRAAGRPGLASERHHGDAAPEARRTARA